LGIVTDKFELLNDYETEIYHLISSEFLRLENEEIKKSGKKRGKG